jgi:hypothetical protein
MSIIFSHKILCRYERVENGDNVKWDRDPSIVACDAAICDLPGRKRHDGAFFGQTRLIHLLFMVRYDWM